MSATICKCCGEKMDADNPPTMSNPNVCYWCAFNVAEKLSPNVSDSGRWVAKEVKP
jgi:hypothetical protein